MAEVRCPHCGNHLGESENNYYACESCSTMFHTVVAADGKIQAEMD